MNTSEIAKILRVIFSGDRSTISFRSPEWGEYQALYNFAQFLDEDEAETLDAFRLLDVVIDVLIKGKNLVAAGTAASGGRYTTAIQARAYAVAQLQMAGRVLAWNQRECASHRKADAEADKRLSTKNRAAAAQNNTL